MKSVLAHYRACTVLGIELVCIKMFDDIVRTLTKVRHIHDMKENFISLCTLHIKGFQYSGEGGVLRIFSVILIVMCGHLERGL